MNYQHLLERSWELVKKHRSLWWLGLFAAFTEGGLSTFRGPGGGIVIPSGSPTPTPSASVVPAGVTVENGAISSGLHQGQVLGAQAVHSSFGWLNSHLPLLLVFLVAALLVGIVIIYCSYASRAGLIHSVDKLEEGHKELPFEKAFKAGQPFAGRLFRFDLYLILFGIIAFVVFLTIGLATVLSGNAMVLTVFFAILSVLFVLVFGVSISVMRLIGSRGIVLKKQEPMEAWIDAYQVCRKHWKASLGSFLVMLLTSILLFLAIAVVAALIFGAVVLAFYGLIQAMSFNLAVALGAIVIFILGLIVWFISGLMAAFTSAYWTLVYRKLTR